MYGSGLAMRLAGEDAMASEVARLPGLESSHVLRDTIRGDAESLGFEDVLNLPSEAAEAPKASLHDRAERLYGIGGGGPGNYQVERCVMIRHRSDARRQ